MAPSTFIFQTPSDGFLSTIQTESQLAIVPTRLIPYVIRALELRGHAKWDDSSFLTAQQCMRVLIVSMLLNLKYELTEPTRQLYRLLDSVYNGAAYTAESSLDPLEPPTITPRIPDVPDAADLGLMPASALRARLEVMRHALAMELRAMRGTANVSSSIRDSAQDPFELDMASLAMLKDSSDLTNQKLQVLIDVMNTESVDIGDIVDNVLDIAAAIGPLLALLA